MSSWSRKVASTPRPMHVGCATRARTRSCRRAAHAFSRPRGGDQGTRHMIRVKICGICDLEAANVAVEAGGGLIGVHFFDSHRPGSPGEARSIIEGLPGPPEIVRGVIDETPDEGRQIA